MNTARTLERNLCYLILLFICLKQESYVSAGKIDISNDFKKIVFAYVKQQLELKCPIEMVDSSDTRIYFDWYRGDLSLYNEQGYTITKKGILKIKSITKEHSGTYTCEGVNGYGFLRVNMTVIVENPEVEIENRTAYNQNLANPVYGSPPIIKKRPPTSVTDDVGGQVTFHCVASAEPTPHIFWFKDGQLIEDAESESSKGRIHSTLRLRGLRKSDAGVYKCIARNKVGEDDLDFTLHVADPSYPPTIVALEPSSVTIKEGSSAVFWCEVRSKPGCKLHIKWLKKLNTGDPMNIDDVTLFRSGTTYYRPLNLSDGVGTNGSHKSKLIIAKSLKDDSGIYVCLALNDRGYNVKNVTLTVIGAATKPFSWPSYFSTRSISFVATVVIALVIVLAAIMTVTHLYCRGKSQKTNEPIMKQSSALLKKFDGKDTYPEMKDFQSKIKLLCVDSPCEHTEHQISRSVHLKQ